MSGKVDYYQILQIDHRATPRQIRQAFSRHLAAFPETADPARHPRYQKLLKAYKVLGDPQRRQRYDAILAGMGTGSLQVQLSLSRGQITVTDAAQIIYMLVDVQAEQQEEGQQRPLNLCLVIDRSTSMRGERLERVKEAVSLIVEKLAPDDIISVVSFSDRADVVSPPSRIHKKQTLLAQMRGIIASGGTEIYQGLETGIRQIQQALSDQYAHHLILLTDGHTYGDEEECLQLAAQAAAWNIDFSAFGIGAEWNDRFLDKLVAPSGGQSSFIETPEKIVQYLEKRIQGLGNTHARNVRLKLDFPRSLSLQYGFKLIPYAQPLVSVRHEVKLGNIEGRVPLSFLLEIQIAPQPKETVIEIPITLVADIPTQNGQECVVKKKQQLPVLSSAPPPDPSDDLLKAVRLLNLYRMNEKVWEEVEAGELDMATRRMRHLSTRLLEAGEAKLAQQALVETERLVMMEDLSPEGRKQLKFGTRAMMSEALTEVVRTQNDDSVQ